MRFPLCVAFLTVCIVAWECTASDVVSEGIKNGSEGASEAAVTATTTTAAPTPDVQVQQPINAPEQNNGEKEDTQRKLAGEHGQPPEKNPAKGQVKGDTHQPASDDKPPIRGGDQTERRDAPVDVAASQAASQTTTTAENVNSDHLHKGTLEHAKNNKIPDIKSGQKAHAEKSGGQITQDVEEAEVSHGDAAQKRREQKHPEVEDVSADLSEVEGPSTTEVKSHTATAAVEKPSGPKGDNGKENSNGSAKKETPDHEVRDRIKAGQTTTPTVTKTGGESAQSTTSSGGATGDKKEQKASLVPSRTTDTTEKKDNQAPITPGTNPGEKETIQEQKQTSTTTTTAEPTTSTVAPTTTLPKGFKLPQSLDKRDGSSSSTSLLIAFATFITFTVIAVAPVY